MNRPTRPVVVSANREIAPGAYLLAFERDFDFIPGQLIGITTNIRLDQRLYSIASGADTRDVRILYTLKPEGKLTPDLSAVKAGDRIQISDPFGKFRCNEKKAVWIAAGTGIAPFASMFFSGQDEGKTLIFGNSHQNRLYFHDAFSSSHAMRYYPCTSQESLPGIFHGRVTRFLQDWGSFPSDQPFYICGSAEMVVDVRDILIARGVPFQSIMAEIFF